LAGQNDSMSRAYFNKSYDRIGAAASIRCSQSVGSLPVSLLRGRHN
jgi:hypothetical protein